MDIIHRQHLLLNPQVRFIKTHPDAQLPKANNSEIGTGDSGYDLTAVEDTSISRFGIVPVGLTLAILKRDFGLELNLEAGSDSSTTFNRI